VTESWARKPALATISSSNSHPHTSNSSKMHSQPLIFSYRPSNHHKLIKYADPKGNTERPSFPYLKELSGNPQYARSEHDCPKVAKELGNNR